MSESNTDKHNEEQWIVFLSSYPPRECGIASFTSNLIRGIDTASTPNIKTRVIAINRPGKRTKYSNKVIFSVTEDDEQSFLEAAQYINSLPHVRAVVIEHEFGLFGSYAGKALFPFLETVHVPVYANLHTVLEHPDTYEKKAINMLNKHCERFIVMNDSSRNLFLKQYGIEKKKVVTIPHAVPDILPYNQKRIKKNLGFKKNKLLVSFGFLSKNKGLELIIQALPAIAKTEPSVLFLIVGQTHPNVKEKHGEEYRDFLKSEIKKLGVQKHVRFINKYLPDDQIFRYLKAADIFISPSKNPEQAVSGTLSFALGHGKAIVSTPFLHAKDIAQKGLAELVSFNSPESVATAVNELLTNPSKRKKLESATYTYSKNLTPKNIAIAHLKLLGINSEYFNIPKPSLSHIERLTDDFSLFQFAKKISPDIAFGYCVDDVCRALYLETLHYQRYRNGNLLNHISSYLDFIAYVQGEDGRFFNYVDIHKRIDTKDWSADAHARTLHALAFLTGEKSVPKKHRDRAAELFISGLRPKNLFRRIRTRSFFIIALYYFSKSSYSTRLSFHAADEIAVHADFIHSKLKKHSDDSWIWFEDELTYANALLPEALYYSFLATNSKKYLTSAETSLGFLEKTVFRNNEYLETIGNEKWYKKNEFRSLFDEQPIEAARMTMLYRVAFEVTKNEHYKKMMLISYSWFLGNNRLSRVMYTPKTGGCYDGLRKNGVNTNQGAESTIMCQIARMYLEDDVNIL